MEKVIVGLSTYRLEGRTLSGTAHVYGQVTTDGRKHSFAPGAFSAAIAAGKLKSFAWHDERLLLGSQAAGTLRLRDGEKLGFELDLPETTYGEDLRALAARKEPIGMSFAVTGGESKLVKGVRVFSRADLVSVDPVAMPAFEGTSVQLNSAQEAEPVLSQTVKMRARFLAKV